MTYLKKYFLPWLIIFSLCFILPLLFNSDTANDDAYVVMPILALVLALICSSLIYFASTKWGPREVMKKMNKPPFTHFLEQGFEKKEDHIIGFINGYQVIIQYHWLGLSGRPSLTFEILFNPKRNHTFITQDRIDALNKMYKKAGLIWNRNFLMKEWNIKFKLPAYKTVSPVILHSIELIRQEKLAPISLAGMEAMIPEMEKYLTDEANRKD